MVSVYHLWIYSPDHFMSIIFVTSCCFFSVFVAAFLRLRGQVLRWHRHLMQPQLQVAVTLVTWLAARTSLTENPGRAFSNLATSLRCDDSDPGRQRCWTWPARPRSPSLIGRCVSCQGTMWGSLRNIKPASKGVEKIWKGVASWINMANVISKLKPNEDNLEFVLFLWRKSTEAFQASKGRRMSLQISKGQHFNDGLKK